LSEEATVSIAVIKGSLCPLRLWRFSVQRGGQLSPLARICARTDANLDSCFVCVEQLSQSSPSGRKIVLLADRAVTIFRVRRVRSKFCILLCTLDGLIWGKVHQIEPGSIDIAFIHRFYPPTAKIGATSAPLSATQFLIFPMKAR
jgi:hypothetical protein